MDLYYGYNISFYLLVVLFLGVMVSAFLMLIAEDYKPTKRLTVRDKVLRFGERFYSRLSTILAVGMVITIIVLYSMGSKISAARFDYINEGIFNGTAISIVMEERTEDLEKGESLYKVLTSDGTYEVRVKNRINSDLTFDYVMEK